MTNGVDNYDPFEFVPERISPVTADGLAWLDEQLHKENKARLRSLPIERQVTVLAGFIEAARSASGLVSSKTSSTPGRSASATGTATARRPTDEPPAIHGARPGPLYALWT